MQVAVGDHDGVLQVFSVKKQEISHVFKSLPTGPITRLELGGALGTVKDKVRPWVVQITPFVVQLMIYHRDVVKIGSKSSLAQLC